MAVATATWTQSPWPKGQDFFHRRFVAHGTIAISASPATYPSGGIPITLATPTNQNVLVLPANSHGSPITVYIESRAGSGYQYNWITADLWTSKYKGNTVAAGQALTDSNGNLQVCTTGGTAGSGAEPTWATPGATGSTGGTTTDNTVVWTLTQAPSLGTIQICQSAGSAAPLAEIAQGTTIASGISG